MENSLLISDAAREVQVESHVLRYWEEELQLPIRRNEQGHRYYTREDVERFRQIKNMKEQGLQLKAIRTLLKGGELPEQPMSTDVGREEKLQKFQWVLQQMIREAVQENNAELVQQVRESVLKELDYQFRMQEEREEERNRKVLEKAEEHYKQVDALLRAKSRNRKLRWPDRREEDSPDKISQEHMSKVHSRFLLFRRRGKEEAMPKN